MYNIGLHGIVWDYIGHYETVWDCMELFGIVWVCMGLYGAVWDCLGLHGVMWHSIGLLREVIIIYVGGRILSSYCSIGYLISESMLEDSGLLASIRHVNMQQLLPIRDLSMGEE